jgi:hypothetical protein
MDNRQRDGFLLEFHQTRGAVKVCAIDPLTGIEVSIVGAPHATQAELSRLAIQKLRYRLNKEQQDTATEPQDPGKGIIV